MRRRAPPGPRDARRRASRSLLFGFPPSGGLAAVSALCTRPPLVALPSGPAFYVAPTGLPGNTGALGSPWDLQTALNQPAAVVPGAILYLRDGIYALPAGSEWVCRLQGTQANPILVTAYPGEHPRLQGCLHTYDLSAGGCRDTWFMGFEIYHPAPNTGTLRFSNINGRGTRCRYINLVVHDSPSTGITMFDEVSGAGTDSAEAHGCLSYNNGYTDNNDHGFYVNQGSATGSRLLQDNISFNNWSIGIQANADPPHDIINVVSTGNILFNNGTIANAGGYDLLYSLEGGFTLGAAGSQVTNNYTYRNDGQHSTEFGWWLGDPDNDGVFTGNYVVGLAEFADWVTLTVSNNIFYSTSGPALAYTRGHVINRHVTAGHTYANNTFYGDATALRFGYKSALDGASPRLIDVLGGSTFADWKTATGLSNPGTFAGSTPPNLVVVRPNRYELGRANIVVYNWTNAASASIDLSATLCIGDTYAIRHVFDIYGTPLVSGVYTGSAVTLPMTAIAPPALLGTRTGAATPPTPGPTFGAFVLQAA